MDSTLKRIQRLEEDLQAIKSVLDRNKTIMRDMFMQTGSFIFLMGFAGVSFTLICFSYYAALRIYGGPELIPSAFNWVFGTAIVALFAVASIIKLMVFLRRAGKYKERPQTVLFMMLFKSPIIVHVFYPIMALIIGLSIFLISRGMAPYCVAVWAVGLGILWNAVGSGFSLVEYIVFGWWLIVTGVLTMVFPNIHPLIWAGVIFGVGFLWITVYLVIAEKRREARTRTARVDAR